MIIQNILFDPLILTIPDDTMLFSILEPDAVSSNKFIAENYINFYARRHPYVKDVIFRFETLIDYESIYGLIRVFIPAEFMKDTVSSSDNLAKILSHQFYINMPVSQKEIEFYSTDKNEHHHMLIYGVDTEKNTFFCKDFNGMSFEAFTTTSDSLVRSSDIYFNPFSTESDGILAFKINKELSFSINYTKVSMELTKLLHGTCIGDFDAYGLSAIDYFIYDISRVEVNDRFLFRWLETANYLREAAKLMEVRCKIILKDLSDRNFVVHEKQSGLYDSLQTLNACTNRLFFSVYRSFATHNNSPKIISSFSSLGEKCRDAFKCVATILLDIIQTYLM